MNRYEKACEDLRLAVIEFAQAETLYHYQTRPERVLRGMASNRAHRIKRHLKQIGVNL